MKRLSLPAGFSHLVLDWYRNNQRPLPWRKELNPYHVWLSEIMLQQTRVQTMLDYYQRFLNRFPTIESLAAASEEEVLGLWSGLGYYSRARNLMKAARLICSNHDGQFPSSYRDVMALPGIGRYTAGAILSISFGQPYPVLDGNVRRILARYLKIEEPMRQVESQFWQLLEQQVQQSDVQPWVDDFNQGLMELGALVCTPRKPRCSVCPLQDSCRARIAGMETELPIPPPRRNVESLDFVVAVLRNRDGFLIRRNRTGPFLKGFWEFPLVEGTPRKGTADRFCERHGLQLQLTEQLPRVTHQITFRKITFHPFLGRLESAPVGSGWRWDPLAKGTLPVSSYIRKIQRTLPSAWSVQDG